MRRFELVEGASSKFWEVALSGRDVTVRYGRIGTNGQTKTKSLASEAAAQKEHDALVKEKTGKGYAEIGAAAGASLAAVTSTASASPPPAAAPARGAAPAAPGFQWTPALRAALPVVRDIHVPPQPELAIALEQLPRLSDPVATDGGDERLARAGALLGRTWARWTAASGAEHIASERLARRDHEFWLELGVQMIHATHDLRREAGEAHSKGGFIWTLQAGLALHGAAFMLPIAIDLYRVLDSNDAVPGKYADVATRRGGRLHPLRHAIAACDDGEHARVIELLEQGYAGTPFDRLLRALLCPHRPDWAAAALVDERAADGGIKLRETVMPAEVMRPYLAAAHPEYARIEPAVLLQLHLHGVGAFELLADLTRRAGKDDGFSKYVALLGRLPAPPTLALLEELSARKEARAQLDKLRERYPDAAGTAAAGVDAAVRDDASPAMPATDSAAIEWPQGGFQWTDGLRKELPFVRGLHAAAPVNAKALLARPLKFHDSGHRSHDDAFLALTNALKAAWTPWSVAELAEAQRPERIGAADAAFWLELCAQALHGYFKRPGDVVYNYYVDYGLHWATQVGIGLHGLPFMIEVAFELARGTQISAHDHQFHKVFNSQIRPLRDAITCCDEAEHAAVIELLECRAGATPLDRLLRAALCPHREDWVVASMAERPDADQQFLTDAVAPAAAMRAYLKNAYYVHFSAMQPGLLLQLRLHGDAAGPVLGDMVRNAYDRDNAERFTGLLARLHAPDTLRELVELIERKEARAALDKLAERWPAAALLATIEQAFATRSRFAEGWAVRLALREPAARAQVLAALDEGTRTRFQALLDALQTTEADAALLPPLLREPPWLRKSRATDLPTLTVAPHATPDRIDWEGDAKARATAYKVNSHYNRSADPIDYALSELQIRREGRTRVRAGQPLLPEDIQIKDASFYGAWPTAVLMLPDAGGLALWNSYPGKHWYDWHGISDTVQAILARHGEPAVPGLAVYVQAAPEVGLTIALHVDSATLVPTALHALHKLKKAKAPAVAWLRAHADTALVAALPLAFGADRALRESAQVGLRWFVANGFEARARAAAASYGAEMATALQALLDADPLLVLPARMPKLPTFFVAPALRRPLLRDGGAALPTAALEHLGTMLAISKLEAPYPGLAIVRDLCTPASLAEFAWDLFEAWLAGGAPSKEGWAFTALGLLGDDETARRLAPRIREWPGESAHQRAVTGLDLLAAIGSDVALMHLNGIAGKVKFKALQDRAKEKIAAVAEARGFTAAELADRLVPDLGLDEQGTALLDFGPRRFTVAFDETLKPFARDGAGARLKDLPKPLKSDDAELAEAATERWKQLKKDAKAIASLQVMRLEMSMIERRRWSATDFRLFFLEHPLMRHLAARLVWGIYDAAGAVLGAFRVAEDWTLADSADMQIELPDDAQVGLIHVLELPDALRDAFGQLFADYAILQPFRQLGRETFALTDAERAGTEIKRFEAKTVATGSVMGLVSRGWERGEAQDGGWVGWFSKRVGDGLQIDLELDPGTTVGDISYEPRQRIPKIVLRRMGTWDGEGHVRFAALDPIIASEVLRDAELLAPLKETAP